MIPAEVQGSAELITWNQVNCRLAIRNAHRFQVLCNCGNPELPRPEVADIAFEVLINHATKWERFESNLSGFAGQEPIYNQLTYRLIIRPRNLLQSLIDGLLSRSSPCYRLIGGNFEVRENLKRDIDRLGSVILNATNNVDSIMMRRVWLRCIPLIELKVAVLGRRIIRIEITL